MAQLLQQLWQNDPGDTQFWIDLDENNGVYESEWTEALLQNNHVKNILFDFSEDLMANSNWGSLLRAISAHRNLEEVILWDHLKEEQRNPPEVYNSFLPAIQQNHSIETVRLVFVRLSGRLIASFLDAATSVTTFGLHRCDMQASEGDQGTQELAAALQRNTNIRTLFLIRLDDIYLVPILESLAANSHVKELVLNLFNPSLAASDAVIRLLKSTSTIEELELQHYNFTEDTFRPIAQGLINSESVTDIKFEQCTFHDEGSTFLFKSIFESKSNIRSLSIKNCRLPGGQLSGKVFTDLLRPDSSLRTFELSHFDLNAYFTTKVEDFEVFLEAVAKSPLEHFCIKTINTHERCQALIGIIPKMQVKSLEVGLAGHLRHLKSDIIRAVKKNASLHTVIGKELPRDRDLFNEDDRQILNSYTIRNEHLSQWLANPSTLPEEEWAYALESAHVTTGPDTVFSILQALAPILVPRFH